MRVFSQIDASHVIPQQSTVSNLCSRCGNMAIWTNGFYTNDSLSELQAKSHSCDLCALFYECSMRSGVSSQANIQFFRVGSSFKRNLSDPLILSILAGPGSTTVPLEVQRGFPKLPEAGSKTQFQLIREWIRACDQTHECRPRGGGRLPTRLIDVGDNKNPDLLRLDCSEQRDSENYIALSHRWGDAKVHRTFCTDSTNIKDLERKIDFNELPKTFQDAVTATRNLGVKYLWIDSLCIIQQDDEDWKAESKRMEDVFSSAYCTIAASCASGTTDGFLKSRPVRQCVTVQRGSDAPFYVCEANDNFRSDVEEGELHKRGWVFQERALSRRSIYFAKNQMYWECGQGVRCETLTKLANLKSSFLSDPNFPQSAFGYYKGMKILFFQILYKRYSRLAFTRITDRSIAMAGLEKRLARTYKTHGEFGILQVYLHRSLLWQRRGDAPMNRIPYNTDRKVPSWSWMAVEGAIKYIEVPFAGVNWSEEIQSPFKDVPDDAAAHRWHSSSMEIGAVARDFSLVPGQGSGELILDQPGGTKIEKLKCVVVATQKLERPRDSQKHYVLLVAPTHSRVDCKTYERVGVAVIEKRHISFEDTALKVRIL